MMVYSISAFLWKQNDENYYYYYYYYYDEDYDQDVPLPKQKSERQSLNPNVGRIISAMLKRNR